MIRPTESIKMIVSPIKPMQQKDRPIKTFEEYQKSCTAIILSATTHGSIHNTTMMPLTVRLDQNISARLAVHENICPHDERFGIIEAEARNGSLHDIHRSQHGTAFRDKDHGRGFVEAEACYP